MDPDEGGSMVATCTKLVRTTTGVVLSRGIRHGPYSGLRG